MLVITFGYDNTCDFIIGPKSIVPNFLYAKIAWNNNIPA